MLQIFPTASSFNSRADLISETAQMLHTITDAYPTLFEAALNPYAKAETQDAFKAFRKKYDLESIFKENLKTNIGNDAASIYDARKAAAETLHYAGLNQHDCLLRAKASGKIRDDLNVLETQAEQLAMYLLQCSLLLEQTNIYDGKKTHYTSPAIISLAHTKTKLTMGHIGQFQAPPRTPA